eukprot:TRINITY_DN587_c0_g1_i3.p1 TRINITY_DN587_c0_g1~~TRINITY_DN587_c0_g1_i3.p1  ORF type:complete len:1001 (-),score=200.14 TRINITY_DN587_c0_g1_i3:470-3322(-)
MSAIVFLATGFNLNTGNSNFRIMNHPIVDDYDGFNNAYELLQAPPLEHYEVIPERSVNTESLIVMMQAKPTTGNLFEGSLFEIYTELESYILNHPSLDRVIQLDYSDPNNVKPKTITSFTSSWGTYYNNTADAVRGLADDSEPLPFPYSTYPPAATANLRTGLRIGLVDKYFGADNHKARALRIIVPLGGPFEGYNNTDISASAQETMLGNVMVDDFLPTLKKYTGRSDVTVVFWAPGIVDVIVDELLLGDASLAIGSLMVVWLYMWFHTKSLYFSTLGMFQMIVSFPVTYFIHKIIYGFYWMGILNFLSLFILLGIGADDVFIIVDAWKQSHGAGKRVNSTLASKMTFTWVRASKTMLVTTCTTAAAFFANALSEIPPIMEFGIFTGTLVIINYLLVISFFSAVLIIRHKYLRSYFFFCIPNRSVDCLPWILSDEEREEVNVRKASGDNELRWLERFFRSPYTKGLFKARYVVIGVFLVICAIAGYFATGISPDDKAAVFLPDDNLLQMFVAMTNDEFYSDPRVRSVKLHLVWGVKGVDREAADVTDVEDFGKTVYESAAEFNIDASNAVDVQVSVLNSCVKFFQLDGEDASQPLFRTDSRYCFMEAYQDYLEASNVTWPIAGDQFVDSLCDWRTAAKPDGEGTWESEIDCQGEGASRRIVWFHVWGVSTLPAAIPESRSRKVYDRVEALAQEIVDDPSTPSVLRRMFQTCSLYVGMQTESELVRSALVGIIVSLSVVLVALIICTNDILLTLWAFLSIAGIVASILGIMVMVGWKLGIIESICVAILAGLSVDYIVHLAVAFRETEITKAERQSGKPMRYLRVRNAVTELGISVLSAAITTLLSAALLLFTQVLFFVKFGQFMMIAIACAVVWAFGCFISFLFVWVPSRPPSFAPACFACYSHLSIASTFMFVDLFLCSRSGPYHEAHDVLVLVPVTLPLLQMLWRLR